MSGLVCAQELRKRYPKADFKLFYITGFERSNVDSEFLKLAEGFLQKPIRVQTIKEIIMSID